MIEESIMIAVRLPEQIEKKLNAYAQAYNKTKTDIVKEALTLYFKKNDAKKTAYEVGEHLFGKYGSGREDLSSTYKQKLKKKIRAK